MDEEVDEQMIKLAERYADVLQDIKRLEKETQWNENDVEIAEKYVKTLERIKELKEEVEVEE